MDLEEWRTSFQIKADGLPHGDTWKLEFDNTIQPEHPQRGWNEYIRKTGTRFRCSMCRKFWSSNKVTVVFHMRLYRHKGTVRVFRVRQSCNQCNSAPMEDPSVNQMNRGILMRNLVKKIKIRYYNEPDCPREYNHRPLPNGFHDTAHCEACNLNICAN